MICLGGNANSDLTQLLSIVSLYMSIGSEGNCMKQTCNSKTTEKRSLEIFTRHNPHFLMEKYHIGRTQNHFKRKAPCPGHHDNYPFIRSSNENSKNLIQISITCTRDWCHRGVVPYCTLCTTHCLGRC